MQLLPRHSRGKLAAISKPPDSERQVRFNLACFLVRSEGKTILVDTGLGPKPADSPETPWGELMADMEAHGVKPEDIDMVVMTHAHRDHVGWNLLSPDGQFYDRSGGQSQDSGGPPFPGPNIG